VSNLLTIRCPDAGTITKEKSWLSSDARNGVTALSVNNGSGFGNAATKEPLAIGNLYEDTCELNSLAVGVVAANSLTVSGAIRLSHHRNEEVTSLNYDKAKIYKATSETGTFALLATVDLQLDQQDFVYLDSVGIVTDWYKISWYNSFTLDESQLCAPFQPNLYTSLDPQTFRRDYLMGLRMSDYYGNPVRDDALLRHLQRATASVETYLGMPIAATNITDELHDYHASDYVQWGFMKLFKKPVISVSKIAIFFPDNQELVSFPISWVHLDKHAGQITLVPNIGTVSTFMIGSSIFLPLMAGRLMHVPQIWHVDYRAGFESGTMPKDLEDVIFKKAAIGLISVLGDNIYGPGISSKSLSIDGLSQSFGTVSSGLYGMYASRINQFQTDIDKSLPELKRRYQGIRMVVC
jgi:hypothetical protein